MKGVSRAHNLEASQRLPASDAVHIVEVKEVSVMHLVDKVRLLPKATGLEMGLTEETVDRGKVARVRQRCYGGCRLVEPLLGPWAEAITGVVLRVGYWRATNRGPSR